MPCSGEEKAYQAGKEMSREEWEILNPGCSWEEVCRIKPEDEEERP